MEAFYPLFDSHCHMDDPRFDEDRAEVITQMQEEQVACTCVGADMPTSRAVMALANKYRHIWAAVGMHPHDSKDFTKADLRALLSWVREDRVVAIGEIGLDYHYDHSPRAVQREVFVMQLELAMELSFPTILHVREAHGDTLDILRARKDKLPGIIVHCYSGSLESAKLYLDLGCMISFAGPVTFPSAHKLREVADYVPLERLLIETDSPYQAPQPVRGQRNAPYNVRYVCEKVAELRNMQPVDLARITYANAVNFYGIDAAELP